MDSLEWDNLLNRDNIRIIEFEGAVNRYKY